MSGVSSAKSKKKKKKRKAAKKVRLVVDETDKSANLADSTIANIPGGQDESRLDAALVEDEDENRSHLNHGNQRGQDEEQPLEKSRATNLGKRSTIIEEESALSSILLKPQRPVATGVQEELDSLADRQIQTPHLGSEQSKKIVEAMLSTKQAVEDKEFILPEDTLMQKEMPLRPLPDQDHKQIRLPSGVIKP